MRNLSIWHLIILLLVIVLVFGVRRIPELGAGLGKGIREFKRNLVGNREGERQDPSDDQERREPKRLSD